VYKYTFKDENNVYSYFIRAAPTLVPTNLRDHIDQMIPIIVSQQYMVWQNLNDNKETRFASEQKANDTIITNMREVARLIREADKDAAPSNAQSPQDIYDELVERIRKRRGVWHFVNIRLLLDWQERCTATKMRATCIGNACATIDAADAKMWKECIALLPGCTNFDQVCCSIFEYTVPRDAMLRKIYLAAKVCIRCGSAVKHKASKCKRVLRGVLSRDVVFDVSCSICGLLTHTAEKCTAWAKQQRFIAWNIDNDDE
jgi:hypothetical protein